MTSVSQVLKKVHTALFKKSGRSKVARIFRLAILSIFSSFNKDIPMIYRLKNGNKFVVHPKDYLSMEIYLSRRYEELETKIVRLLVQEGDTVIDIGANIGYYTALLSKFVGSHGEVYSFEPGKVTYLKLQQTVKYLGLKNVNISQIAVGHRDGVIDFFESTSGNDAQQAIKEWEGMKLVNGSYVQTSVEMKSLDSFVTEKNINLEKVSFVKCDVEGFEKFVLEGSTLLLNSLSPPIWQIEINKMALSKNQSNAEEVVSIFIFSGYTCYFTPLTFSLDSEKSEKLKKLPLNLDDLPEISNLYAFPLQGIYSSRLEKICREDLLDS